jgi:hypothetical protein
MIGLFTKCRAGSGSFYSAEARRTPREQIIRSCSRVRLKCSPDVWRRSWDGASRDARGDHIN